MWKPLFEDDLDTSSEDIYADNINMDSKSDSLSMWGTVEDDQIMIEDVKIDDVEVNDHIMVELLSKKQHLCYITQVQQKNQES